jgi:multidrug transporter EmrE-like cation transporter
MIPGIVFSVLTGCCFAVGAGLFAAVARRGLPFMLFLSMGATIGLAISLLAIVDWAALSAETRGVQLALWIVPGALANVAGHRAMANAMAGGRSSVAWAIGQGGQAVPFIATVLIWNEHAGAVSWLGLALILVGVAILARTKTVAAPSAATASPSPTWVYWALAALLCYGMNGTLMSVPSHWPGWHDGAHLRVPITLGVFALAGIACSPGADWQAIRRLSRLAVPYGLTLAACFACLYRALDALSAAGGAAIAWPLACSTGVVAYALWEHLVQRRPIARSEIAGIATVVAGIVAMAIRTPFLFPKS